MTPATYNITTTFGDTYDGASFTYEKPAATPEDVSNSVNQYFESISS